MHDTSYNYLYWQIWKSMIKSATDSLVIIHIVIVSESTAHYVSHASGARTYHAVVVMRVVYMGVYHNMLLLSDGLGSPGVSVTLPDTVTGSKACIGEEVMYTCTVGGAEGLLWYSAAFGEITMACNSKPRSEGCAWFLAYAYVTGGPKQNGQQSIISTLSVTTSVLLNNTQITCMNTGRTCNSTSTLQVIGKQ